jgi:hypothetical protein
MDELNNPNLGTNEQDFAQGQLDTLTDLPSEQNNLTESSEQDFSLPENSNDRTKEQFQKLLQSNKELKEQLQKLASTKNSESNPYGSVYDSIKSDSVQGNTSASDSYVDEEGNVDIAKLNKDLMEAKNSALEAKALAQKAREDLEVREAHMKHPYLNPQSSEFDPTFFELVKDRVLRQKFYENKTVSLGEVADQVISFYKPSSIKSAESAKAIEDYKKAQSQIANNAPLSNSNRARQEGPNLDDLRARTRTGDSKAIIERLKNIGI